MILTKRVISISLNLQMTSNLRIVMNQLSKLEIGKEQMKQKTISNAWIRADAQ